MKACGFLSELPVVADVIGGKTGLGLRDPEFPVGTITLYWGKGLRILDIATVNDRQCFSEASIL